MSASLSQPTWITALDVMRALYQFRPMAHLDRGSEVDHPSVSATGRPHGLTTAVRVGPVGPDLFG